jgi:hypothetical protein
MIEMMIKEIDGNKLIVTDLLNKVNLIDVKIK